VERSDTRSVVTREGLAPRKGRKESLGQLGEPGFRLASTPEGAVVAAQDFGVVCVDRECWRSSSLFRALMHKEVY
jgi:hypothetical protein